MGDNNFHSDPIMRLRAERSAQTAADHKQVAKPLKESRSVTMIIYAWAAIGLVAFGVATTSLVTHTDDHFPGQTAKAPQSAPVPHKATAELAAASEEIDLITTSSVNVQPTVPAIVNIYPRSHNPETVDFAHGAQVGSATDLDGLVAVFTALEKRSPELLKDLDPLVSFNDNGSQIAANLIAGPFETHQASTAFCAAVKAAALLPCTPAAYQGDKLLGD